MEHRSSIINPKTNMPYGEQTDSLAGVPLTLKQFPALQDAEVQVLRLTAERSLMDGHHPQTGVAFPLQAMCQIVVLIDDLKSQISDLEDELESYRDSRTGEE